MNIEYLCPLCGESVINDKCNCTKDDLRNRIGRLNMELQAARAGHRTTYGCYETEKSARIMAERERDLAVAALEEYGGCSLACDDRRIEGEPCTCGFQRWAKDVAPQLLRARDDKSFRLGAAEWLRKVAKDAAYYLTGDTYNSHSDDLRDLACKIEKGEVIL